VLAILPCIARADYWTARFQEAGIGWFDRMQIEMVTDGALFFEQDTFRNFEPADTGWTTTITGERTATAEGPEIESLRFDIAFAGDGDAPLEFVFKAFSPYYPADDPGSAPRLTALASYDPSMPTGQQWTIAWTDEDFLPIVVPLPATAVGTVACFCVLASVRRLSRHL
jgi:hypothetical protein